MSFSPIGARGRGSASARTRFCAGISKRWKTTQESPKVIATKAMRAMGEKKTSRPTPIRSMIRTVAS